MIKNIISKFQSIKKIEQVLDDIYLLHNIETLTPNLLNVFNSEKFSDLKVLNLEEKIYNSSFFSRYRLRIARQYVDIARQVISFSSSEVEKIFEKALEVSPINDDTVINDYIIYEFNYGINDNKLKELINLHFSTSFKWKNNEKNRLVHSINILLKINNNEIQSAKNYLKGYIKEFGYEGLEAIPKVAYFAYQNGIINEFIEYSSYIAGEVLRTQQDMLFERELKDKNIFIVGNSPNGIGKNKGKIIDNSDYIVRFNRGINIPEKNKNDYGKKTNIWVRNNAGPYNDYHNLKKVKFCILIDSIERMHWKKEQLKNCYKNLIKSKCRLIAPTRSFHQKFFKKYNFSRFTSGILAINYLESLLKINNINLIGFSSMDNIDSESFYSQKQLSFYSKTNTMENKGFMNHSFKMEKLAIKDILNSEN